MTEGVGKALIMAGGKGTRLHPYSATMPKPLMPIGDTPILEVLLNRLKNAGVTHVILAVNHLRHLIEAFFGDGSRFGLNITYSFEDKPLGTAGPIGAVIGELGHDFIVTNGDLLTTLDVGAMIAAHRQSNADVTIGSYERELKSDFGILEVDDSNLMIEYREKPVYKHLVSMGIYVVRADAIKSFVKAGEYLDMPDLLRTVVKAGHQVRCYRENCFWLDIGRPDDFAMAQKLYDENPAFFLDGRT